ncbi:DUF2188 domain-containing protein [Candidatus Poriferisodalis sp.]|uniref:DUF2188 domain-containing protein n=1 Tax=Candidatus Poriferisodalis sp. TaxID=3101277 RepID=UPI003B58D11D
MGDKRLVVKNRAGGWDVRAPGAHNPVSQHATLEEAERAAGEWRQRVGGGKISIFL